MHEAIVGGAAVPVAADVTISLAVLGYDNPHLMASIPARAAACALALGVVVQCAARTPRGSRERKSLARAAEALREVV